MKIKKILIGILFIVLLCASLLAVSSCNINEGDALVYEKIEGKEEYCLTSVKNRVGNEVIIPSTYKGLPVTEIGDYAFDKKTKIQTITIGKNVASIGKESFSDCVSLINIIVEDGNKYFCSIDGSLYNNDATTLVQYALGKNETSFVVPNDVISIGDFAFSNSKNLTSVEIPNGVTFIGEYAFSYSSSLTNISIPDSLINIGYNAFYRCDNLNGNIEGTLNYLGNETNPYVCLIGVTSTNVTNETISSNCKFIGDFVFDDCVSLTSISIPNSVTSMGGAVFRGCSNLKSVIFEENSQLTSIGASAFCNCSSLTSVTIPNGVTSIGYGAFSGCGELPSITIPNNVTSIGYDVFDYCDKLSSINVEEGNNYFSSLNGNLYNKEGTILIQYAIGKQNTSFTIPNSVTTIGASAFSGCRNLVSITIPNSVINIRNEAFSNCTSLTSIEIPNSVATIGNDVFYNCTNLSYNIEGDLKYLGNSTNPYLVLVSATSTDIISATINTNCKIIGNNAFFNYKSLTSVTIGENVTTIGNYAFWNCASLTSVNIPNSVTSIGDSAFYDCSSLISIEISESVTSIGSSAFLRCSRLKRVTFENPNGWWWSLSNNATSGTSISSSSLANPTTAAKYLTETYTHFWKRG